MVGELGEGKLMNDLRKIGTGDRRSDSKKDKETPFGLISQLLIREEFTWSVPDTKWTVSVT